MRSNKACYRALTYQGIFSEIESEINTTLFRLTDVTSIESENKGYFLEYYVAPNGQSLKHTLR